MKIQNGLPFLDKATNVKTYRKKILATMQNAPSEKYESQSKELLSTIVPCRDEVESVEIFYNEFCRAIADVGNLDFELIFVEDGSKDGTLAALRALAKKDGRVKYISLSRNFGKEAAMLAGFENAKGDYVCTMDVDLQDPPILLPQMIEILREHQNVDSVAAKKKSREDESGFRAFLAGAFYKIINRLSSVKFKDGARDFRLMRRRMLNEVLRLQEANRFTKGLFEWVGFNTRWIEFQPVHRATGKTKWSPFGLMKYSLDAITSFSTFPLEVVSMLGLAMCALSSFAIVFLSIRELIYHNSAFGWTSMICIIFFLSGIQLFCIGILGHYLSKIYIESKDRPKYIIAEKSL